MVETASGATFAPGPDRARAAVAGKGGAPCCRWRAAAAGEGGIAKSPLALHVALSMAAQQLPYSDLHRWAGHRYRRPGAGSDL